MSFNPPDQQALEKYRDAAESESRLAPCLSHHPAHFISAPSSSGSHDPGHAAYAVVEEHRAYWSANGGSPYPDIFFPGFERGWHDAISALSPGNGLPGDLEGWAKQRAGECSQPEYAWEWEHGFKQGAEAAKEAGTT